GAGQDRLGIYIKSVVKGGAADADGQLQAGDQLLKVDGQSLVGITQEKAAEYLVRTGPTVTLEVAKQGAIYHGLATLLQQPSPVMGRGPRRMSERDLPSRLLSEQNHNGDSRRNLAPHAPIQSSKSVPSLNSGNNDLVHGPTSPNSGPNSTPGTKQHEVFNPGYSRTSSTNSIPQKTTYEAQAPPAGGAGLRSKSSQNLNDPRSPNSALPPTGLGSRQSSNPSLHHSPHPQSAIHPHHMNQHPHPAHLNPQHPSQNQHPPPHMNHHPQQSMHQTQMHPAQNHPAHNQHVMNQHLINQHQMNQQNQMQSHQDGERFYQNLSIYRNHELHNGYPPPKVQHINKRVYVAHSHLFTGMAPRSQSTRDIMRQEAKLQEMQEEVRRREMRGGVTSPQHYPVQPAGHPRPQMLPGHPQQRLPNTNYSYHSPDPNGPMHPQHNTMMPYSQTPPGHSHPQNANAHPLSPPYNGARPHGNYGPPPTAPKPTRYPGPMQAGGEAPRPQYPGDAHHQEMQGHVRPPVGSDAHGSVRPSMLPEDVGYRDSPPPPPPPTSTHPLYQSGNANTGQKAAVTANSDNRYTASMGEPPRGTYYPASPGTSNQPPRAFQFNATNPWEREEREKESVERVQGLLRMATQQQDDTDHNRTQQQNVRRPQIDFQQNGRASTISGAAPNAMPKSALASSGNSIAEDKEKAKRKLPDTESNREQEDRLMHDASKRRNNATNVSRPVTSMSQGATTSNNNNQYVLPTSKPVNPSQLRLDNLVINGPASPPQGHQGNYQSPNAHQQYNGYISSQSSNSTSNYYQHEHSKLPGNTILQSQKTEYYQHQESNANSKPPLSPLQQSGAQRLDSLLLLSGGQQPNNMNDRNSNAAVPPQPPERGSSFTVMSQTQGVLRNSTSNMSSAGSERSNILHNRSSETNTTTTTTTKRVDPRARLLAAQQHQKLLSNRAGPLPEKLSFKEKMKMFAMETGEDGTPRDKVKISRAQRDIDNLGTPTGSNNAAN
ncbi:hypothetical protein C0J52_07115, partial [Blattella germanica]